MDAVGVDGALLVSPFALYRFDASYALQVHAAHPGRFGLIKPVDTANPGVADVIAEWAGTEGTVAHPDHAEPGGLIRPGRPRHQPGAGCRGTTRAAGQSAVLGPVAIRPLGWPPRNPDTVLVIDHLGLHQPFQPPVPAEPWADLPKVLALASHRNITDQDQRACTLSHQPFPYHDIWDPLMKIIDAFGLDRCMWGTDWTRATELLTYQQGVAPFRTTDRLSDSDRAALMGGTLERVYSWAPSRPAR